MEYILTIEGQRVGHEAAKPEAEVRPILAERVGNIKLEYSWKLGGWTIPIIERLGDRERREKRPPKVNHERMTEVFSPLDRAVNEGGRNLFDDPPTDLPHLLCQIEQLRSNKTKRGLKRHGGL